MTSSCKSPCDGAHTHSHFLSVYWKVTISLTEEKRTLLFIGDGSQTTLYQSKGHTGFLITFWLAHPSETMMHTDTTQLVYSQKVMCVCGKLICCINLHFAKMNSSLFISNFISLQIPIKNLKMRQFPFKKEASIPKKRD